MRHLYVFSLLRSAFPSPQPAGKSSMALFQALSSSGRMAASYEGRHDGILGGRFQPSPECSRCVCGSDGFQCFRTGIRRPSTPRSSRARCTLGMGGGSTGIVHTALATGSFGYWPAGTKLSPGPRARRFCSCTARDPGPSLRERGGRPRSARREIVHHDPRRRARLLGSEICRRLTQRGNPVRGWSGRHRITIGSPQRRPRRRAGAGGSEDRASLDGRVSRASAVISTASSTMSRQDGDSIESADRKGHCISSTPLRRPGGQQLILISFSSFAPISRSSLPSGRSRSGCGEWHDLHHLQPTFFPTCC